MNENYAAAIDQYDRFIRRSENGAETTKAELERSDCYLQLGFQAKEKKNTLLASRLFYLSNSRIADSYLDNIYFDLSVITREEDDIPKTLEYYNIILDNFTDSEMIPEVLYNKIEISISQKQNEEALADYRFFYANYADNRFRIEAEKLVNPILPDFIAEIDQQFANREYDSALANYLNLYLLPTSYKSDISNKISETYWNMANNHVKDNPELARDNFLKVVEYNNSRLQEVNKRYQQICQNLVNDGDELISRYQLDEAEIKFQTCFIFIPDYQNGKVGLLEIDELRNRNANAEKYITKASNAEKEKRFADALSYYRQANEYVRTKETSDKIFLLSNQLKADKDSKGFTLKIIKGYKRGVLENRLKALEANMINEFGDEVVKSTGWKVLYSSGKYKQEVRYDILGPDATHYFIWQVDLLKQKISPLNKESEKLMD